MVILDRIYGRIEIKEKVIKELILAKPLQRLKKISQDGAPHFIQPIRDVSRFEHSVGVWSLSRKFNRPIEEQIACLLHDVPHTAFSHVADLVFDDEHHEFHEKFTEKIILNSEIPDLLKKYGLDLKKVLQKEKFALLENKLPDLSFDRWDYFVRDGLMMNFLPKTLVNEFMENIYLSKDRLYFKDPKMASVFAILFLSFSRLIWLDPTSHGSFFLIANALKIALAEKLIIEEDFFTDDELLMSKLRRTKNSQIHKLLDRLKPGKEFIYAPEEEAEFFGPNKPRYVDPWVKSQGKFTRLSGLVPNLDDYFKEFKTKYKNLGVNQL